MGKIANLFGKLIAPTANEPVDLMTLPLDVLELRVKEALVRRGYAVSPIASDSDRSSACCQVYTGAPGRNAFCLVRVLSPLAALEDVDDEIAGIARFGSECSRLIIGGILFSPSPLSAGAIAEGARHGLRLYSGCEMDAFIK